MSYQKNYENKILKQLFLVYLPSEYLNNYHWGFSQKHITVKYKIQQFLDECAILHTPLKYTDLSVQGLGAYIFSSLSTWFPLRQFDNHAKELLLCFNPTHIHSFIPIGILSLTTANKLYQYLPNIKRMYDLACTDVIMTTHTTVIFLSIDSVHAQENSI